MDPGFPSLGKFGLEFITPEVEGAEGLKGWTLILHIFLVAETKELSRGKKTRTSCKGLTIARI